MELFVLFAFQSAMGAGAWPHDMYASARAVPSGVDLRATLTSGDVSTPGVLALKQKSLTTGRKVTILNLDDSVSQDDIEVGMKLFIKCLQFNMLLLKQLYCDVSAFDAGNCVSMQELVKSIGPYKSVTMVATGVAEVVFVKSTDALKVHKQYNQVKLDGKLPSALCVMLFERPRQGRFRDTWAGVHVWCCTLL
eukprot:TRINITY_DN9497_c0_g3_i5.p1 TRINITY_DN9497_c0_g3~~TRINITY_DN9497_c0_g3_i5.p1  ORF type:complete len:193 (+),score=22.37 TRINITY_DN9497_c0_g3_i5:464-1042(+)